MSNSKVKAEEIPNANVEYSYSELRVVSGVDANGNAKKDNIAPLWVTRNGKKELAFCLEPYISIPNEITNGYTGTSENDVNKKIQLASVLWKDALGGYSINNVLITQAYIWEHLTGENYFKVNSAEGISNQALSDGKRKLDNAIAAYDLPPSFDGQTIKLKYGQSTEIVNQTSGVNLKNYDSQLANTGNVKVEVQSDKLVVTPTEVNQTSGVLAFEKSYKKGSPYVYRKNGVQTVMVGAIEDPANYSVKFDIETTGNVKIAKIDEKTGATIPNTKFHVTFSGTNAPQPQDVVTGSDGTYTIKDVPNGVKVTATETSVPAPYVLSSVQGGSDSVEGTVTTGQTLELTKKNNVATGQIIVNKTGVETGTTLWNTNYTLENNVFEIHKDSETGKVVETIKTDKNGRATSSNTLELGTYYVTEKTASQGFANTFKTQKVELKYKDQAVAVNVGTVAGTNQEVTGTTTLLKQDAETGSDTQGKSTFKGAEYTLYHNDTNNKGTVVKWNETSKPALKEGSKANNDNVVVRIDEKTLKATISHLPLGQYYWLETKNPEGYQIDSTKHEFSIDYKDQNTKVVTSYSTSKENVIKFNFSAFKYVNSLNGSAQAGYNDIEFTLTPLEGTKGDKQTTVTKTDKDGNDGFLEFANIPYGDYKLEETKTPEGFKTIAPLIINSSYDSANKLYTFTITEEGQNEAIKTVNVSEEQINNGSNVIKFSRLSLFDDAIQLPELETVLTGKDNVKTISSKGNVVLEDTLSYENLDNSIGKEVTATGTLTANGEKVLIDGKEITATKTFTPKKAKGTVKITYEFNASKIDSSKIDSLTSFVKLTDDKGTVLVSHEDKDSVEQTVALKNPAIGTTLTDANGQKEIYSKGTIKLKDTIEYSGLDNFIGQEVTVNGSLTANGEKVLVDGKEITATTKFKPNKAAGTVDVTFEFNGSKLDDATLSQLTAFETMVDSEGLVIAEHKDPNDPSQTVKVKNPTIGTTLTDANGQKEVYSKGTIKLKDTIKYSGLDNFVGQEVIVNGSLTANGEKVLVDGKEITATTTFEVEKGSGTVDVTFEFNGSKLDNETLSQLTAFETMVDSEGLVIAEHKDPNDKKQTVNLKKPEIGTTLTTEANGKVLYADGKVKVKDTVEYSGLDNFIGQEVTVNGSLTANGEKVLIDEKEITATTTFKVEKGSGTVDVVFEFDSQKLDKETLSQLTAFETMVDSEGLVIAEHKDPNDPKQTVEVKYPEIHTLATYKEAEGMVIADDSKAESTDDSKAEATDDSKAESTDDSKVEKDVISKEALSGKKVKVADKVFYSNFEKGTYYVVTKALDIESDKFIAEATSTQTVETAGETGEWVIEQVLDTHKIQGHNIVFYEYVYKDKEMKQLINKHEDKNDKDQTISVLVDKTPLIHTNAHTGDNKSKVITPNEKQKAYDDITMSDLRVGKNYVYELKLHRIVGLKVDSEEKGESKISSEKDEIVYENSFKFTADKEEYKKTIDTTIDTSKDDENVIYVWTEQLKDDEDNLLADHSDLSNKDETLTVKVPETPATPETPKKEIPKTGEAILKGATILGMIGLAAIGGLLGYKKYSSKNNGSGSGGIGRF
ncbi:VaFE repeat-containing surface-anchored protein [Enterococcus sp. AZ102]